MQLCFLLIYLPLIPSYCHMVTNYLNESNRSVELSIISTKYESWVSKQSVSNENVSRGASSFSQAERTSAILIPWWRNLGRFRGGRALIWQPITMPPAIAPNPVAELRSGNIGRIATNSGGGVRFATARPLRHHSTTLLVSVHPSLS